MNSAEVTREQRALALFTASLEQPSESRSAWLDQACGGEPALRAEVEQLLAADRLTHGFLDQPPPGAPDPDRRGERLGAFELIEQIGIGGMGRVFRARRVDGGFEQEVAIKLYGAGHLTGSALQRFHAERQILACLEHPGIARVIDGGNAADGTPFIAMELVRGLPITEYYERSGLDLRQRLRLFQRVCEALQIAHQRGIVHRDIKASNVLVDDDGQPRIIDFGIAKVLDAESVGLSLPQTGTQLQMLTPEYASPEQVRGLPVEPSSDVYSLGVLLYELLTGARPYALMVRSPVEIERTVCHSMPVAPSSKVARSITPLPRGLPHHGLLRRQLRGDLDRIVMTALRKEPGQRYASAAALGEDIGRYLAGLPVLARGASRWYRLGKFVQRHRAASVATVTIFVVLIIALVAVSLQARQARIQAERAEAAKSFLTEMISRADPYENAGEATLAGALRQAIPTIGERFAEQPELQAELRYAIGFAMEGLGESDTARDQLSQAMAYFRAAGDPVPIARTLTALGRVDWGDSNYSAALTQYEQALEMLQGLETRAARRARYDVQADLGGLLPKLEQYQRAADVTRSALQLAAELPEVRPLDHAILWNNLANALEGLGDAPGAIAAYERSIALHRQIHSAHPDLATALANLGISYEDAGDLPRAVAMVAEAAQMQAQMLGPQHPQALLARFNLGSLQLNAGQLEAAADNLSAAAEGANTAYAPNHLYTGRFHHRLGEVSLALGRLEQASTYTATAARIYAQNPETPERWKTALDELMTRIPAGDTVAGD
ncbi:MAG: serine/threonine protein kinase [Xanthomonadales bacterium]|nr:serine/threonine protein kinase [Xanthomonadales bacterium]MCP5476475.1 serine/threonine protein kinase [Rhodanobacteraceae bacterium]